MRKFMLALPVLAACLIGHAALAADSGGPWHVVASTFGVQVTNGTDTSIRAPDAKAGEEMADILNDAEAKKEKKNKPKPR